MLQAYFFLLKAQFYYFACLKMVEDSSNTSSRSPRFYWRKSRRITEKKIPTNNKGEKAYPTKILKTAKSETWRKKLLIPSNKTNQNNRVNETKQWKQKQTKTTKNSDAHQVQRKYVNYAALKFWSPRLRWTTTSLPLHMNQISPGFGCGHAVRAIICNLRFQHKPGLSPKPHPTPNLSSNSNPGPNPITGPTVALDWP